MSGKIAAAFSNKGLMCTKLLKCKTTTEQLKTTHCFPKNLTFKVL